MFCKYCGKQIGDQAAFCPYCGEKLVPPDNTPSYPQIPIQQSIQTQKNPANGFGIAAFVIGILSLVVGFYLFFIAAVGIVLGAVGVAYRKKYSLNGLAVAGLVMSCAAFVFWGIFWLLALFSISFVRLFFLPFLYYA